MGALDSNENCHDNGSQYSTCFATYTNDVYIRSGYVAIVTSQSNRQRATFKLQNTLSEDVMSKMLCALNSLKNRTLFAQPTAAFLQACWRVSGQRFLVKILHNVYQL